MIGSPCRSHALTVASLTAGLALLPFDRVYAGATAPVSNAGEPAPIQRPKAMQPASEETTAVEAATFEPEAAPEPEPPTDTDIDPELLEGDGEEAKRPPPRALRPHVVDPEAEQAALRRKYQEQFRPADNPGRLALGVRTLFANAGGGDRVGGRMGGVQIDLGQNFNRFGYAITGQAWGGRVFLDQETDAEMNAMFGAGPTLNLGRLALQGQGFLDLRVGYDFFYGVVNEQRDDPTVLAPQADPDIQFAQTENLAPHGPRAQLNMGLLLGRTKRGHWHGLGVSAGYQGLVHSFRGELPYTHMLTLGLSYWMG